MTNPRPEHLLISNLKNKKIVDLTNIATCATKASMVNSKIEKNPTPYDVENSVESFHWWFAIRRRLLRSILSSLNIPTNCLTLDLGCGTGSNLRTLNSAGLCAIGLDLSIYALNLVAGKKNKENLRLLAGDLTRLPIKTKSLGLVIAMDILEHLDDDMNGIYETYRILSNGGILIVTVPAFKFLWGTQDVVTGHKRRYSRKEITTKLKDAGFDILRSSYFNFILFFPILFARRIIRLVGLRIESENKINSPLINFFLKTIFSLEPSILKYFSIPFGVSIFCVAKK